MAKALTGKVALVTGAARGIGQAVALRLARGGPAVVFNYAGSARQAQETVGLIEQAGAKAIAEQADVSKVADVKRLFDAWFERFDRLDVLVNNAGVTFTKPVVDVGLSAGVIEGSIPKPLSGAVPPTCGFKHVAN